MSSETRQKVKCFLDLAGGLGENCLRTMPLGAQLFCLCRNLLYRTLHFAR